MTTSTTNRVTVKLFAGCLLTSEIRMYLKQSAAWKQAQIVGEFDVREIVETHYQEKDYLGRYLASNNLTIIELHEIESSIRKALTTFCPELASESLKIYVFPQVFIT